MADLEELAGRVEALAGPDREVDRLIQTAMLVGVDLGYDDGDRPTLAYTASIDAAMTLAPDNWYRIEQQETRDGAWARVTTLDAKGYTPMVEAYATAAVRALTAAFLRSRTQGNQNG